MSYWRATKLVFRPSLARDDWERIDANLTVAMGNLVAIAVMLAVTVAIRVWLWVS